MKKLQVFYAGWGERWLLGTLADTGAQVLFEYSNEARAQKLELSPLRAPLSHTSAITGEPHFMGLPGLLADALPDGWGLLLMDRAFRQAGRLPEQVSVLERLAFIGERAMGALIFVPAEEVAPEPSALDLAQLARETEQVLTDQDADAALRHLLWLGGSPQGARPKVLVNYNPASGQISAPGGLGEPWLIKFPSGEEHRDACAIEALYARLARHCGLEMPPTHFFALSDGYTAFGVQRFDRDAGLRVPIISLAAALNVDFRLPSLDYEILLRLTRRMTGDEREVIKAFERCVFNVLTHNRDDHGHNFAFRLDRERRWRLAPAFDLTYNEGPRGEHFTSVVGEGRAPARSHLLELAKRGGIPQAEAKAVLERQCEGMLALPELARDLPIRKTRLADLQRILGEDRKRIVHP